MGWGGVNQLMGVRKGVGEIDMGVRKTGMTGGRESAVETEVDWT